MCDLVLGASLLISVYVFRYHFGHSKDADQNAEPTERLWLAVCKEAY